MAMAVPACKTVGTFEEPSVMLNANQKTGEAWERGYCTALSEIEMQSLWVWLVCFAVVSSTPVSLELGCLVVESLTI